MNRFIKQWFCNHSWHHHWLYTPANAMELRTCNICHKSEVIRMISK